MGEVYRARDPRLGREVAIKVLPEEMAKDGSRLHRFEQEARVVGSLSHPNLLSLYDVGRDDGVSYLVTELLEGRSLRDLLESGPLPARKAVEHAQQIARGLSAAHAKGVVHRDLKPANFFVARDGALKILDFGIAKLTQPDPRTSASLDPSTDTAEGRVVGTVGYMAPEQVRGLGVDARSDIFAFGAVLYEMLSGRRAFQGETTADTLTAILTKSPEELSRPGLALPPGLERIVLRCLEKDPEERFQSARDVAFALEAEGTATTATAARAPAAAGQGRRRLVLGVAVLAAAFAGSFLWGTRVGRPTSPSFTRVTFRRGIVDSARFTPDGETVIYSARWDGKPSEVFSQRLATAEARTVGLTGASVEKTAGGEMAVVLASGTLARVPLEGGSPREVVDSVAGADWKRDGTAFAIVRNVGDHQRLEYPIGQVLHETTGIERIGFPRISPRGDSVAFIDWTLGVGHRAGDVAVADLSGRMRTLSRGWGWLEGLAWSPEGSEVWFTASRFGVTRALHAVTLSGKERLVLRVPENLAIQDVARNGRVLLSHGRVRIEMWGRMAGDAADRDLTWLGTSVTAIVSPDGKQIVLQGTDERGPLMASAHLRRMDGSPPVRLADGEPFDVSPDWKHVLCGIGRRQLRLVPIGPGEARTLPRGTIDGYRWAFFHPDGQRIVVVGNERGRPLRLFVQDLPAGLPRPFSPEGVGFSFPAALFSPDGRCFCARPPGPPAPRVLYPIDGGEPRPIPWLGTRDQPLFWGEDGRSLFVWAPSAGIAATISRLDLESGHRARWLGLAPADPEGVRDVLPWFSSNGRYYAYSYWRTPSDLFLVEGLR
jgi:hypothetical protein